MKVSYIESLRLPKGFPVSQYETLKEIQTAVGGDDTKVVDIVNKYLRQKGPLVEGRDLLSTYVEEKFTFPIKTEKVTKTIDGKATTLSVPTETEGKHLERFVAAVVKGSVTPAGFTITATDDENREKQAWSALQTVADTFKLIVDAKTPERGPSKARKLPQYALNGAAAIIKNGTQKKWADTFKKENVSFEDFQVKDDPEGNVQRLARAIVERENRAPKPQYA